MRIGVLIVILLFVVLLAGYVGWQLWRIAPGVWKWVMPVIFVLWAASFFAGFFVIERLPMGFATVVYEVGNTWLIAFLYLLLSFAVANLAAACHLLPKEYLRDSAAGLFAVVGVVATIMTIGALHYRHKYREEMTIVTDKPLARPLTVIMASDLHLGYHNRKAELARWIDLINAEKPDLVLIGGDIIDFSIRPVLEGNYAEEFRRIKAPVYTVLGNHEYYSHEKHAKRFFKEAGIVLLKDSVAHIYGLDVIGRDDRTNPHRLTIRQIKENDSVADSRFSILLEHQPLHLEEAEAAGIDFQFSGHTHRGQVWPISWITDAIYEKAWGIHQRGRTQYYVSSGLGIWGAKVRIGTRSEYLVLHIETHYE